MKIKILIIAGLSIMASQTLCWGASIVLEWDPNTESTLAGYRLYQANKSMIDSNPGQAMADNTIAKIDISDVTANSITVNGLALKTLYFFRLTALDTSNNQSDFNVDTAGHAFEVMVIIDPDEPKSVRKFLSPGVHDGINDEAEFSAATEVTITDFNGRKIAHLMETSPGLGVIWKCKDDSGKLVPTGVYIAKIKTRTGSTIFQSLCIAK
jgi:hypothetical protein